MRKELILPGTAVVGGILGFFLRRWELSAAFEAESGLAIPGAPSTLLLIALSAVLAAVFFLLCRGNHNPFPGGYDQAFGAKGNSAYIAVVVLSGFLLLGAAVLTGMDTMKTLSAVYSAQQRLLAADLLSAVPKLLLAVLCLGSFFCVLSVGKNNYRGEGHGKRSFTLLMPAYTACLWLISAYQVRAGDPVRLDYIYELFAIIAALLGLYFTAGFAFERAKVFRASFFSLLGIYFSLVTLADAHSLATTLLYVFMLLYLTANVTALLLNDRIAPAVRTSVGTPVPEEKDTEVTPDE